MTIRILDSPMPLTDIKRLAQETYGFMIKGCADIEKSRVAIGGDYHIESCEELTRTGSALENVWGFNVVFTDTGYGIEYDSLINIKPARGNRSRLVEDEAVCASIERSVTRMIV